MTKRILIGLALFTYVSTFNLVLQRTVSRHNLLKNFFLKSAIKQ